MTAERAARPVVDAEARPRPAPDPFAGRFTGGFILRERLSAGGGGLVYRAEQLSLDREAVVKLIVLQPGSAGERVHRFLREARLAARLDHPFATHIYAFGAEPDGVLWIAMELVRGVTLARLVQQRGEMPLDELAPLFTQICEVVHSAHEQGIVHRDLKPSNVMVVARAGRLLPKLLDLGIARLMAPLAPRSSLATAPLAPGKLVRPGRGDEGDAVPAGATESRSPTGAGEPGERRQLLGSPPYMAPEQWRDAAAAGPAADQYALAVLGYELLTGRLPFRGGDLEALARAHQRDPPEPLEDRWPRALDAALRRALAKEPGDRYPSVLALAAALREAAGLSEERRRLGAHDVALEALS